MGRKPTLTPGLTISRWCAGRNERTRPSRMIVPLERVSLTDGSGELERNPQASVHLPVFAQRATRRALHIDVPSARFPEPTFNP